jgi:hypothetical protein
MNKDKAGTKYYLGEIVEQFGEYESTSFFTFIVPPRKKLATVERRIAQEFRGINKRDEDGWYYFDFNRHGDVFSREVTKEEFDVLSKYFGRLP